MITYDLSGKTALVTGSNRGIGKAMADALEDAGAKVVRTCSKECDLSDRKAVYEFIERVKKEHQIDILVNNAGTILRKPAAEHPDEYWDKVINVNLNSQFVLAREFGRGMVERGWGKIVFTCSLLTTTPPRSGPTRSARARSSSAFRRGAGARQRTSRARAYSSARRRRHTSTERSCRSTAAGSPGSLWPTHALEVLQ